MRYVQSIATGLYKVARKTSLLVGEDVSAVFLRGSIPLKNTITPTRVLTCINTQTLPIIQGTDLRCFDRLF